MNRFFLNLLLSLLIGLAALPALAQETAAPINSTDKLRYVPSTLPNISDLLFKKGVLKTDDPAGLEEYIRIHHCGLYEQYGRDEFAWSRIRESMGRDLDIRMRDIPDGLEIANTVILDQYDMGAGQFSIIKKKQMNNISLVTLLDQRSGSFLPCKGDIFSPFVPRVHPLGLILKLDQIVTLNAVPMSRKMADALIALMNKREGSDRVRRTVLVVMRVRITGLDPLSVTTDPMRRTVLGQIDDLRVYEGPDRKLLVFRKDFGALRAAAGKN